jgi:hypothetical protein
VYWVTLFCTPIHLPPAAVEQREALAVAHINTICCSVVLLYTRWHTDAAAGVHVLQQTQNDTAIQMDVEVAVQGSAAGITATRRSAQRTDALLSVCVRGVAGAVGAQRITRLLSPGTHYLRVKVSDTTWAFQLLRCTDITTPNVQPFSCKSNCIRLIEGTWRH